MSALSAEVLQFVGRARANPANAVAPEQLDSLLAAARADLSDTRVALMSPPAPLTLMSRVVLATTEDYSRVDTVQTFGRPVEIVGLYPEILNLGDETETNQPPMAALDVAVSRTKGQTNYITATNQTATAAQPEASPNFVSLSSVSSVIANRTLTYRIEDPQALLSFQYRWSVDAAVRASKLWANVQISMNIFYRLLTDDLRR